MTPHTYRIAKSVTSSDNGKKLGAIPFVVTEIR
jgi:hypothetical protein